MNRGMWTAVADAFRRAALPLASYYAVTLALPLANGAAQSGPPFVDHAVVVVVVPPVVIMFACAVHMISHVVAKVFRSAIYLRAHLWSD